MTPNADGYGIVHRLRVRLAVYRAGVGFGQPRCCCLRYAFSRYSGHAARRGFTRTAEGGLFVPCGLFHKADNPPWSSDRPPFNHRRELGVREVRRAMNLPCGGSGLEVDMLPEGGGSHKTAHCTICRTIVGCWATAAEIEVAGRVVLRANNHPTS